MVSVAREPFLSATAALADSVLIQTAAARLLCGAQRVFLVGPGSPSYTPAPLATKRPVVSSTGSLPLNKKSRPAQHVPVRSDLSLTPHTILRSQLQAPAPSPLRLSPIISAEPAMASIESLYGDEDEVVVEASGTIADMPLATPSTVPEMPLPKTPLSRTNSSISKNDDAALAALEAYIRPTSDDSAPTLPSSPNNSSDSAEAMLQRQQQPQLFALLQKEVAPAAEPAVGVNNNEDNVTEWRQEELVPPPPPAAPQPPLPLHDEFFANLIAMPDMPQFANDSDLGPADKGLISSGFSSAGHSSACGSPPAFLDIDDKSFDFVSSNLPLSDPLAPPPPPPATPTPTPAPSPASFIVSAPVIRRPYIPRGIDASTANPAWKLELACLELMVRRNRDHIHGRISERPQL